MNRSIRFHKSAFRELFDATAYYEKRREHLGLRFLDEVRGATRMLAEYPEVGRLIRGRVRQWVLPGFPFTLFYSTPQGEVRILAVAHGKRRPFYWEDRF